MKIRVKFSSGDTTVHRLDIPNTASLVELEHQLRESIPQLHSAPSLTLSLNKKDIICGVPEDRLAALGVCSGDTLWIMSQVPASANQSGAAATAPVPAPSSGTLAPSGHLADPDSSRAHAAPCTGASNNAHADLGSNKTDAGLESNKAQAPFDGDGDLGDLMDEDVEFVGAAEGPSVPDFLQRVMAASLEGATSASPHHLLQLATHAVMLESGFTACPSGTASQYHVAHHCQQLQYTWRGVPLEQRAVIRFLPLGPYLLLHTSVEGTATKRVGTINLSTSEHAAGVWFQAPNTEPTTTTAGGAPHSGAESGSEACFAAAASTSATTSSGNSAAASTSATTSSGNAAEAPAQFQNLPALWTQMKDTVALPLMASLHHAVGRQLPLGLLTLPMEMKLDVLRRLQAKDLAAVAASCSELRHLSSIDQLWQPLFTKDFPTCSVSDRQEAERRGFKWAYSRHHQRRSANQRRRFNVPRPYPLTFPVGGPRLFTPPFPLGAIGGDYDRLPMPDLRGPGGIMGGTFGGLHGLDPTGGPGFPGQRAGGRRGRNSLLNSFRQY